MGVVRLFISEKLVTSENFVKELKHGVYLYLARPQLLRARYSVLGPVLCLSLPPSCPCVRVRAVGWLRLVGWIVGWYAVG